MLRVAVIGATGYTGAELLRLLSAHPAVRITAATSEKEAGRPTGEVFSHLHGLEGLVLEAFDPGSLPARADFFFLALPHTTGMAAVAALVADGKKVVDLSADFRLKDAGEYAQWYNTPHAHPGLLDTAVYGLPEVYRDRIRKASLVASPGCFPTGALLGLIPMVKAEVIDTEGIVINALSGVSGAGRQPKPDYHFPEVNESARAYGVATHRHRPEIDQELSLAAGRPVRTVFTPHLVPMTRGILTTITARLNPSASAPEIRQRTAVFFDREPFLRPLPEGQWPATRDVRGSNYCHVGMTVDALSGRLILVTAIDNLVKGASGQAVQNMNLMMGFEETLGLEGAGIFP